MLAVTGVERRSGSLLIRAGACEALGAKRAGCLAADASRFCAIPPQVIQVGRGTAWQELRVPVRSLDSIFPSGPLMENLFAGQPRDEGYAEMPNRL